MWFGEEAPSPVAIPDSGGIPLQHSVVAREALGGQFVELRCVQTDEPAEGRGRYEALYLIGFDSTAGEYVYHLFDSTGVSKDSRFGLGKLRGESVAFRFEYVTGLFVNTLTRTELGWEWLLTYFKDGEERVFAVKEMRRSRES